MTAHDYSNANNMSVKLIKHRNW